MNLKHLPIVVAIALPVVFIAVVWAIIFIPSYSIKPAHNFVFTTEYSYSQNQYENYYHVNNGVLVQAPTGSVTNEVRIYESAPTLYLYDVSNSTSHEITYETASKLVLDPGPSSPDGYSVEYRYSHNGIFELFGSSRDSGYRIVKGNASKKISGLPGGRNYGSNNFNLIGWVK